MKALRLFVLVLLAALLPGRGVDAAMLWCEHPSAPQQAAGHAHDPDAPAAAADHHAQHERTGFDEGHHCLSSCTAAVLLMAPPSVAMPALAGSAVFPRFAAPAPTFQSDGPERPPRSL